MAELGKILAVDDDIRNLEIFKHLLENQYQLATASTGEEALQKVSTFGPDLVLLDIMMPGINGYDVCRMIKQSEDNLTKVILVSAKAMIDERLMGYEAGADDYIAKPFDHEEFLAKIKIFIKLKKAEDELRRLNTSLENVVLLRTKQLVEAERQANKSRNYIDNIIKSMIDPLIVLSLDSKIERVNSATTHFLHYTAEELIGKPMSSFITEKGIFNGTEYENLIKNGFVGNQSLTFISKSGEPIPALLSRSMIRDEEGHISGIVCVAKDMTEQRKIEKEKDIIYQQLLQASKLASIGELAAGIAHEINNPLTIIQGNSDIIADYFTEINNEEYSKFVLYQQEALRRITNIVNGLRTYARIDSVELTAFDIHQVLTQTVAIVNQIYKNESILIQTQFESTKPIVCGSSGRFQQVMMNLISNARDAMVENDQTDGKINICTKNEKDNVKITVSDNGCGIPPEKLKKIFDPFYTSKPAGKGTGLGLSIALSIINEMKGEVQVDSKLGVGTTFTLLFPVSSLESTEGVKEEENEGVKKNDDIRLKGRVLIADDEAAIAGLLKRYLLECHLEVDTVSDGQQALDRLTTHKYDLLITDLKMPKLDGEELIRHIKNSSLEKTLKIVAMTGNMSYANVGQTAERLEKMVHGFIKKPFSKKEVYPLLQKLLTSSK